MNKLNVGIIFGGRSAEHDVSIQSAKNIFNNIDKEKYNLLLIKITKEGEWRLIKSFNDQGNKISLTLEDLNIDVIFPVLHGPFGEDGTIQGLLKIINIPFVGSGVLGSSISMDKDISKQLLENNNIPVAKYITLFEDNISYEEVRDKLNIPFFIKPANMGSSIGISKVNNKEEYIKGIKEAFKYDNKIIIEEYIKGREIDCAVLGNNNPIAFIPGEILLDNKFYSYNNKYNNDNIKLDIPAKLDKEIVKKIQELSIQVFKILSVKGLGRVDFFLTEDNKIIVNEINTMPGFTKSSMYPKLLEYSGISYANIITKLIELSLEK